ncbi:hypothetical protein SAY86_001347 [Trapa natans]|uniref:Helicase ATP-binding domain-containing protein n=1 Tax=Trapa natans TaxID=22666 RepID=A0AAN7MDE6_TRANT|nr:hypothetical protein SAY86_001347 [Trapa natans]
MGLKMITLDEADHLLDLGFPKYIEKIVDALPRKRHSLLFSATIQNDVRQSWLVAPRGKIFQVMYHLKEYILQKSEYRVMVFCTTGTVTSLFQNRENGPGRHSSENTTYMVLEEPVGKGKMVKAFRCFSHGKRVLPQ